jgi:hypothetical protein
MLIGEGQLYEVFISYILAFSSAMFCPIGESGYPTPRSLGAADESDHYFWKSSQRRD